ncbi:hypothetical protein FACS189490_10480 [Clostridia bacterium]|nr:hypothetical protein FACS189490_10480 [Clostridia bacterium]
MTYKKSGALSRVCSAFIDVLLVFCAASVISLFLNNVFLSVIVFYVLGVCYGTACERAFYGVTLGKLALGLKAATVKFRRVSLKSAIICNLLKYSIDLFAGVFLLLFKGVTLGDMLANTTVLSARPRRVKIVLEEVESSEDESGENALLISEEEFLLLDEFFNRRALTADGGEKAFAAISPYFAERFNVPPENMPFETLKILYAVNRANF